MAQVEPSRPAGIGESRFVVAGQADTRRAYFGPEFGWRDTPVLSRSAFSAEPREGPVIIEEYDCTTVVRPGWRISRDEWHNMIVER